MKILRIMPFEQPNDFNTPTILIRSRIIINNAEIKVKDETIIISTRMIITFISSMLSHAKYYMLFCVMVLTVCRVG